MSLSYKSNQNWLNFNQNKVEIASVWKIMFVPFPISLLVLNFVSNCLMWLEIWAVFDLCLYGNNGFIF